MLGIEYLVGGLEKIATYTSDSESEMMARTALKKYQDCKLTRPKGISKEMAESNIVRYSRSDSEFVEYPDDY